MAFGRAEVYTDLELTKEIPAISSSQERAMPRYFFHVTDGAYDADDHGEELENVTAAKCHAVKYAGELICEAHERFWDHGEWHMTVTNDTQLTLFTLTLVGFETSAISAPK